MELKFTQHFPIYTNGIGNNNYTGFRLDKHNKLLISTALTNIVKGWKYVNVFYDADNKKVLFKQGDTGQRITVLGKNAVITCRGLKDKIPQGRYFFEYEYEGGLLFGNTHPTKP